MFSRFSVQFKYLSELIYAASAFITKFYWVSSKNIFNNHIFLHSSCRLHMLPFIAFFDIRKIIYHTKTIPQDCYYYERLISLINQHQSQYFHSNKINIMLFCFYVEKKEKCILIFFPHFNILFVKYLIDKISGRKD